MHIFQFFKYRVFDQTTLIHSYNLTSVMSAHYTLAADTVVPKTANAVTIPRIASQLLAAESLMANTLGATNTATDTLLVDSVSVAPTHTYSAFTFDTATANTGPVLVTINVRCTFLNDTVTLTTTEPLVIPAITTPDGDYVVSTTAVAAAYRPLADAGVRYIAYGTAEALATVTASPISRVHISVNGDGIISIHPIYATPDPTVSVFDTATTVTVLPFSITYSHYTVPPVV